MPRNALIRRLAAIVAMDVVGYSRLTGHDEEWTIVTLRACRQELIDPKVEDFRGRIANTAGDGILIEFPSVVDALRFSLELQADMAKRFSDAGEDARLEYRIGINLGDVVDQDGDLLGDGVNVAARLEGIAEPGGIYLSRAARDQVRDRIDATFDDLGEIKVKNIQRPVRAFRVAPAKGSRLSPLARDVGPRLQKKLVLAAVFVVLAVGASAWLWVYVTERQTRLSGSASAPHASIAVLPFSNLSNDPTQEYFSDGITTDLITDLSKFHDLFVISSNAAFGYRDRTSDVREVGAELGVKYALQGSVQKAGDQIRINAQLIDAETGQSLWAERYNEPVDDLFAVQDQITLEIVRTLAVQLPQIEKDRALSKSTRSLEAYDYVLRGEHLQRQSNRADNLEARAMFEQAIFLDADYSSALTGLGHTLIDDVLFGWTAVPQTALTQAHELAIKALEIDENFDKAHGLLARVHLVRRRYNDALIESEKAIALNPNDPDNHIVQGATLVWSGHPEGAIRALETALRFNPLMGARPLTHLGVAYYLTSRYDDAKTVLERAIQINPDFAYGQTILAATHAMLGDLQQAHRSVEEVHRVDPFFSLDDFGRLFRKSEHAALLVSGLRTAGFGSTTPQSAAEHSPN